MAGKGTTVATRPESGAAQVFSDETLRRFAQMASIVPASDGAGSERILLAILNADNWDALDDPWDTNKTDDIVDQEISIYEISRRPSRFADGLGMFLVIRSKFVGDDKEFVWTSSSVSVVGQLVKAYCLGALPLVAVLRKADTPTERGYHPQHLEILASAGDQKARVIDAQP